MAVYEFKGSRDEAVVVRNRDQDGKELEYIRHGDDGKPVKGANGAKMVDVIRLGSTMDEELPLDTPPTAPLPRPECLVDKKLWARVVRENPVVRGLVRTRRIEVYSAT